MRSSTSSPRASVPASPLIDGGREDLRVLHGRGGPSTMAEASQPMRQDIEFAGGKSLGISVDEDLRVPWRRRSWLFALAARARSQRWQRLGDESRASQVHRVNDPESPAIKKARYGVTHWRIVAVGGAAVADKAALVRALGAAAPGPVMRVAPRPDWCIRRADRPLDVAG